MLGIKKAPATYVPPNYQKLGGSLLDERYDAIWIGLRKRDPDVLHKVSICHRTVTPWTCR